MKDARCVGDRSLYQAQFAGRLQFRYRCSGRREQSAVRHLCLEQEFEHDPHRRFQEGVLEVAEWPSRHPLTQFPLTSEVRQ